MLGLEGGGRDDAAPVESAIASPAATEIGAGDEAVADTSTPVLLTAAEAAALLGVSRSVFYRWDARGDVPRPVRIGRMKRWSRLEVLRWVERRCPPRHKWENDR